MKTLHVSTTSREQMLNITGQIQATLAASDWKNGVVLVYCPHTTCGLTINEGADPDVVRDLTRFFAERIPEHHAWKHAEGNTDAHIKSSLLGCSLPVPVENGRLGLGTWQSIYLYEADGPRSRSVWMQWLPGEA